MLKVKRIIPFILALVLLFTTNAFAAIKQPGEEINSIPSVSLSATGTTAKCTAKVTEYGKSIDATMELWQGSTLIASWNKTGTGIVNFSESETITRGLTYTLTVYGTANGVAFTPKSVTKTL